MPEAVELLYIRHGLICVIEQFSIYVLNVAHVRPRLNCLKIVENGQKSIISFHFVCSFNSLILKIIGCWTNASDTIRVFYVNPKIPTN